MDEPCFCSVEGVLNCLAEKTKVSLPVLLTACALGYIWSARKQMNDMRKQCDVLEDDMRTIKRENFQLCEEIRRLKCAVSDTELFTKALSTCYTSKCQQKNKQCSIADKTVNKTSYPESNKHFSHKIKQRRSRNHSPACKTTDKLMSYSTPEVELNSEYEPTLKTTIPVCNKVDISLYEWCPRAESTGVQQNRTNSEYMQQCNLDVDKKPEKVSFCEPCCYEPKSSKKCNSFKHGSFKDKPSKSRSKHRSRSPAPLLESLDNCRYANRTKPTKNQPQTCQSDVTTSTHCKTSAKEGKWSKQTKPNQTKPNQTKYDFYQELILNCNKTNNLGATKQSTLLDYEYSPCSMPRSSKMRTKIEKFKKDIAKDLTSLSLSSECTLCQKDKASDKASDNESFDLTKSNINSHKCKYTLKGIEKSRCR